MNHDWIVTDLEQLIPASGRSRQSHRDRWIIMDYVTREFAGKLALASPNATPPEIRIPLPLAGRCEILIGMQADYCDRLRVKLASDRGFDRLGYDIPASAGHYGFQEVAWRTVELTGQETLVIAKDGHMRISIGFVALRRVAAAPARASAKRYRLHVTDDGFPGNWGVPATIEEATWMVDRVARLGVDMLSRGIDLAGMANYATGLASHRVDVDALLQGQFVADHAEEAAQIMADEQRRGWCVPRHYYATARQLGLQVFGYHRMAHVKCPAPYESHYSRFYVDHPEWRCAGIDGRPVNRLSYAYPPVRRAIIELLQESVTLGAHGINNVFVRGLPAVLYEEPVRRRFQQLHGIDPVTVPENDPRAEVVRAEFVTEYLREQRAALPAPATIIVTVPATGEVCRFYGLDIPTWVREGLIDVLCPYGFGMNAGEASLELDSFAEAVKGSPVKLMPFVNTWRDKDAAKFLEKAIALTRWPIDGFSVWDGVLRGLAFDQAMRGMGSIEEMTQAVQELRARKATHYDVTMLDGAATDRYGFGWNL